MVYWGQIVVGPPGCGKTTYCHGVSQFMQQMGRPCAIVNLDFANEQSREGMYECAIDVRDLVSLERVMEEYELGPNGGLMYCMEYLLEHSEWLLDKLRDFDSKYIIFDCPGQVELYTHHTAVQDIIKLLQKELDFRLCSVHLVDSFYCCDPATFISAVLNVACTMLRLCLPHVNILTKIDLLPMYGPLPFTLDFFTEMTNLMPLIRYIDNPGGIATEEELLRDDQNNDSDEASVDDAPQSNEKKKRSKISKMSEELCDVLNDYGLVSFLPLNIQDAATLGRILIAIDNANGYRFAATESLEHRKRQQNKNHDNDNETNSEQESLRHMFQVASKDLESTYERSLEIMEKYKN